MDTTTLKRVLDDHAKFLADCSTGRKADLRQADLRQADLLDADLRQADLRGADLRGADLRGVDLWGADLRGANLRDVDLWGADLENANLRGASLRGANLRGANLREADLRGARLLGATLNWQSHELLSEILWQAATTPARQMYAAFIGRNVGWCWDEWEAFEYPEKGWAVKTLAPYAIENEIPAPPPLLAAIRRLARTA
jgi:hypothetical protein